MIEEWLLTTAVLAWWFWAGRQAEQIGLGLPGGWVFWTGAALAAASAAALGAQVATIRTSPGSSSWSVPGIKNFV